MERYRRRSTHLVRKVAKIIVVQTQTEIGSFFSIARPIKKIFWTCPCIQAPFSYQPCKSSRCRTSFLCEKNYSWSYHFNPVIFTQVAWLHGIMSGCLGKKSGKETAGGNLGRMAQTSWPSLDIISPLKQNHIWFQNIFSLQQEHNFKMPHQSFRVNSLLYYHTTICNSTQLNALVAFTVCTVHHDKVRRSSRNSPKPRNRLLGDLCMWSLGEWQETTCNLKDS